MSEDEAAVDGADAGDVDVAGCNVVRIGIMVRFYWDVSVSGAADTTLDD